MEVIGSVYTGVTEDFQRGVYPIARCVKAEKHDLGVVLMEQRRLGNLYGDDRGTGFAGNVWDKTIFLHLLRLCKGGGMREPMIVDKQIVAMRGRNPDNPSDRTAVSPTEQRLEVNMQGTSNCLTSVQKDNLVMESQVLTPKRTEYGKQIRKAYESGQIQESRHNMTELEPRKDNVSNTLTTVQKDNLLLEKPLLLGGVGKENEFGSQYRQGNRVYSSDACAMALNSQLVGNAGGNSYLYNVGYRIRKLTPRECGRLMGVSDEDIDKMAAVNSNTQLYKQFGNSIVVDVMCAMFKNLNINQ